MAVLACTFTDVRALKQEVCSYSLQNQIAGRALVWKYFCRFGFSVSELTSHALMGMDWETSWTDEWVKRNGRIFNIVLACRTCVYSSTAPSKRDIPFFSCKRTATKMAAAISSCTFFGHDTAKRTFFGCCAPKSPFGRSHKLVWVMWLVQECSPGRWYPSFWAPSYCLWWIW